jgi:HEXXH motif-containing protein
MSDVALACADLTVPVEGSQTVRQILSRYLARQYRDLMTLRIAGAEGQALAILQRHCRTAASERPGALFSAIQRTTVGGMIRFLEAGAVNSPRGAEWTRQLASVLYAELALAGAPPPPILLAPAPSRLIVGSAGVCVRFPSGTSTVRLHPDGITIVGASGATIVSWADLVSGGSPLVEPSHLPLRGRSRFALADDSPLAQFETHPDKAGSGLDLGGKSADEWTSALRDALDLVRLGLPSIADEIDLLIEQLVPVGYDAERHLSASYAEFVGTIYLSLHPDVLTLAEALIHEHSHNKINMLWTLAPVLDNAFAPLYSSPFRPDPRPLHGVLLGVHAFLPVERLYEELEARNHPVMRQSGIEQRRQRVRERNAAACDMLKLHAQPTASGRPIVEEIARCNARYA